MKREAIAGFIDLGIRDGRVKAETRETWARMFENDAASAFELFCKLAPNPEQASRNYFSLDDNEKKFIQFASQLGLAPEEVS